MVTVLVSFEDGDDEACESRESSASSLLGVRVKRGEEDEAVSAVTRRMFMLPDVVWMCVLDVAVSSRWQLTLPLAVSMVVWMTLAAGVGSGDSGC